MFPKTHKHITLNKDTYNRIMRLMGAVIKDDDTNEVIKRCHYGSESVFYEELIELGLEIKQKQWNDEKKRLGLCD
jgi:hypothetical protein